MGWGANQTGQAGSEFELRVPETKFGDLDLNQGARGQRPFFRQAAR
jgi:hypothetical protein